MIDEDVFYAIPSSVYRVLRASGMLRKAKGIGYSQPDGPHRKWHIDISYVNILGMFLFLVAIIDGYSRYLLHHELRAAMEEKDVQLVVQRALERFPRYKPRIISDRGSQFIAKDFKEFVRYAGVRHTCTSVGYPQSNGKIERFFRTAKTSCIRRQSFLSIENTRRQLDEFVRYYNHERLHSASRYVTPFDRLVGKNIEIITTRGHTLLEARKARTEYHLKSTLDPDVFLSDSR